MGICVICFGLDDATFYSMLNQGFIVQKTQSICAKVETIYIDENDLYIYKSLIS